MITEPTRIKFKAGEFKVDPDLQRNLDRGRVAAISKKFNPASLGVVSLSQRDNGHTYIVDGQHRDAAAQEVAYDGKMEGNLYVGLTREEEAQLFLDLNDARAVSAVDKFRIAIEAGDRRVLAIAAKLIKHGWAASPVNGEFRISAVIALGKVFDLDGTGAVLDDTLATLTQAYGGHRDSATGSLVYGLGMVISRYGAGIDLGTLANKMAKYPGGAGAILGTARGLAAMRRSAVPFAVAEHLVDTYNVSRREPLPSWR